MIAHAGGRLSPTERLYRIVEEGMCIGCGLCEGVASRDVVQMRVAPNGYERPHVVGDLDHSVVDTIHDSCPGLRQDGLPKASLSRRAIVDRIWGPYISMVSAHASDHQVRVKAASGGVLTALAMCLIDRGLVSFVLHAQPSGDDPTFGVPLVSESVDDVRSGTGSIYGPTAPLRQLDAILRRGEPFAFIAKPCDIAALRNYADHDDRVDALVEYWLTPVCGGIVPPPQMDAFLATCGVRRSDLRSFVYRGDMCPGDTEFETITGDRYTANMYEPYGGIDESSWQLPFRCKVCPDGPGEGADIAAGDQWADDVPNWEFAPHDPGSNAVIVRTEIGAQLWATAMEAGYVTEERIIGPRFYDTCQHHHVTKKRFMRARWDGIGAEGRLQPRSSGLRLEAIAAGNSAEENAAQFDGTRERIRGGTADERMPRGERAARGVE